MKNLLLGNLFAALLLQASPFTAQPVAKADAAALLAELPAPPTTLEAAYQHTYLDGASTPNATAYYQAWFDKFNRVAQENQTLLQEFYRKYPTGVRPQVQPVSRATPQQQASMDAATTELAQKMLNDPAFAQKFMKLSEQEQHAYIADLLAEKGLKPANGTPNANVAPVAGTDVEWGTFCSDFAQSALDMSRWEAQTALQQKYEVQHQEVRDWAEAEIKKLPLIEMGEYGRDRDPEKVSAVRKQALGKHRDVADAMMKEAAAMFALFRQQSQQRITPLNDALKKVNYGADYDFGINYVTVLSTQMMMLGDPNILLKNEISIIEEVAKWEHEWRNFK